MNHTSTYINNYIYIISDGNNIKIGFSKHPKKRLKQLQIGNANKLSLVYAKPSKNARKIEHHLHKILWQFRSQYKSEWFTIKPETWLLNYIDELIKIEN